MSWNENLLYEQERAAKHTGTNARMLAGPGTGKTLVLTRRMLYLIQEKCINPDEILALTFTRAAANELRQRVASELPGQPIPKISTLHSFALKQLLRNSQILQSLPRPLRIADDWEERNIIFEDIKKLLTLKNINEAKELFRQLSADWESLAIEVNQTPPNPKFIGAWEEHREIYGYTMRSELVYQLKRSLEQIGDFQLESPIRYLLVDEYQDLNKCDLAVISAIASRGVELFIAGDDDQSIYGFRKAHPDGIRNFPKEYLGSLDLPLHICKRCDKKILALAEFVANLDTRRINKKTIPEDDRPDGIVEILRFSEEKEEANGIAQLCKSLIDHKQLSPDDILILLRVDTHQAYSKELELAFSKIEIPISINSGSDSPLDENIGRQVLSFLRLSYDHDDHLAWVTLFRLRRNGIGDIRIKTLYDFCHDSGKNFAQIVKDISANPSLVSGFGNLIANEYNKISEILLEIKEIELHGIANDLKLTDVIEGICKKLIEDDNLRNQIVGYLSLVATTSESQNIKDLIINIQVSSMEIESDIERSKVNVLTMHKAKGLTAKAVIIVAAEDEHIPGRHEREPGIGDERRLLYVSLTRAKHFLFVTYCDKRNGQQRMLGRNSGDRSRTLTRFLRHAPIKAIPISEHCLDKLF